MNEPLRIMLVIESSLAHGRNLLCGIARYAKLHGPWQTYRTAPFYRNPYGKKTALECIHDWGADGLILFETKGFEDMIPKGIPTVVESETGEYFNWCGNIVADEEGIGRMDAEYFLGLGFRHFAYCGFEDLYWSSGRCKGYCDFIEKFGYPVHVYRQPNIPAGILWEKEQPYIEEWLRSLPESTAILTCADERGEQVLQACRSMERRIPDDIAIIGADDDELICDFCYPSLSSIAFNTQAVGFKAARLLVAMIRSDLSENDRTIILKPTHISVRQSTDVLAVDDAVVAGALRFIRDNSHRQLTVDMVAEGIATSRRMLERRFQHVLHTSVHTQIVRDRSKKVEELLVNTDLTLFQIAMKLDFTNHQQIDRYFKQSKAMSPTEFRKESRGTYD